MRLRHIENPKVLIDLNVVISAPPSKESSPAKIFEKKRKRFLYKNKVK